MFRFLQQSLVWSLSYSIFFFFFFCFGMQRLEPEKERIIYMQKDAGKGLECPKTMDGKGCNGNGAEKEIPSCCLKAMASLPELEAKCHSTVVSGWFSEFPSTIGVYLFLVMML